MSASSVSTITFTFGAIENHVGMQQLGDIESHGFRIDDLEVIKTNIEAKYPQCTIEIFDLLQYLPRELHNNATPAKVLVVRKFLQNATNERAFLAEHNEKVLPYCDKKAFMKGRVVNKHARYNLCYGNTYQAPDIDNKKGTVLSFDDLPQLQKLRQIIAESCTGTHLHNEISRSNIDVANHILAELNWYYNIAKCGIGYHGDTERKTVMGLRLGPNYTNKPNGADSLPIHYQWYLRSNPVGSNARIDLHHGDFYIMSEKAVGFDWKRQIIPTLRHATGCDKYTRL